MSDEMNKCPESIQEASSREELLLELSNCLKSARETQGLTVEGVALSLKLRTVYINALESGNWDDMPGEVYAIGFLKQYAAHLKIDVSESVELLKTGDYKLTKPLTFPDPPIAPNRTWVIIAALAFVVLFILFNLFDESNSVNVSLESERSVIADSSPPFFQDGPVTKLPDSGSTSTVFMENASIPVTETIEERVADSKVMHEYRLTAVDSDIWLQLSSPDEPPVLIREVLLKSGESISILHNSPFLLLTCGNAPALQVEIDSQRIIEAGSLNEAEKVLRNFKLFAK